jgi:hypothetical protein
VAGVHRLVVLVIVLLASVETAHAQSTAESAQTKGAEQPTGGHDSNSLSQQATDPTAPLLTINLITDFTLSIWGEDDRRTVFKIQPVVPFKLWGLPNIARVILPYQLGGPGPEGMGDVALFDIAVIPISGVRLALGPVFNFSSRESSNPSKFALGPAVGIIVPASPSLTAGLFTQSLFSPDVQLTQLQPILAYQLGGGWSVSAGDLQYTVDWSTGRWSNIPIGAQLGVVCPVFGQPIRFSVGPQYNLIDNGGADRFKVLVGVALLAPKA